MGEKIILPDTNILIPALAKVEPYASFLHDAIEKNHLVLSVIVVAEFLVKATEEEERIFNALTKKIKIIPVDLAVAQLGAFYRKNYLKKGKKIPLPDCFLAATCKVYNLTLCTLDKKDYPFKEIRITDRFWKDIIKT